MSGQRDNKGRFTAGNQAAQKHGVWSYLARADGQSVTPEFAEAEARMLAFLQEYGGAGVIAREAFRASVASDLLWDYMGKSPANLRKYAATWRSLSNASVRDWVQVYELQARGRTEDLEVARQEALARLENQS